MANNEPDKGDETAHDKPQGTAHDAPAPPIPPTAESIEALRQKIVKNWGLPEHTSWKEIHELIDRSR